MTRIHQQRSLYKLLWLTKAKNHQWREFEAKNYQQMSLTLNFLRLKFNNEGNLEVFYD